MLECATLAVPLDYANPAGPTIDVAVIRLRARPDVREGEILLNPGGPGGSGFDSRRRRPKRSTSRWVSTAASTSSASTRGVDRSGGIDCLDDATLDALVYADDTPDDVGEAAAIVARR